jgi:(p)ppGpp synthase/HD superfamily hydrolase
MTQKDLLRDAAAKAARAHRNHTRKDERKTPYFSHPARVALTVAAKFKCTEENVLAAALLHDVLEDTRVDYDDLLEEFDQEIADIVVALSKDTRLVEPEREDEYYRKLAGESWRVKLIKLADVYDNLSDAPCLKILEKAMNSATRTLKITTEPELQDAVRIVTEIEGGAAST